MSNKKEGKTVIAVLASHDSPQKNKKLVEILNGFCTTQNNEKLKEFQFIFTGGTFDRVILDDSSIIKEVESETKEVLIENCGVTRLPPRDEGGITTLSYLIVQQKCSIIWPFLDPLTSHWLMPENLALLRLCDQWHVKKLMNTGSVKEWFKKEAEFDIARNRQGYPLEIQFFDNAKVKAEKGPHEEYYFPVNNDAFPRTHSKQTLALISHDEMKSRMIEFAIDHEQELAKFNRILATGTTGSEVIENTRGLNEKVKRYRSGPKGGDIEIATEILFGRCHVVIFFIDPLNPHPHTEDIRTVLGSCMLRDNVRMFTTEMQARDWMQRVVRP